MRLLSLFTIIVAFSTGCSSSTHSPEVRLVKPVDSVAGINVISTAAVEEMRKIQTLLAARQTALESRIAKERALSAAYVPKGFEKKATLSATMWPDTICEQVAVMAGYTNPPPVHLGLRPPNFMPISINKINVPLWEIAQELGHKSGKHFSMEVIESAGLVRCKYKAH